MNCSPFEVRDYFLKELSEAERQQVEGHVEGCRACRDELERLRMTESALLALRDEEIPQRIGFVSDKIFEPSPWRRAWESFWGSTARLGFASAALLSIAMVVFSLARPAGTPAGPLTGRVSLATISDADIQQRIQVAVDQAVAARDVREKKLEQRVAEIETLNRAENQRVTLAASAVDYLRREQMLQDRSRYLAPSDREDAK